MTTLESQEENQKFVRSIFPGACLLRTLLNNYVVHASSTTCSAELGRGLTELSAWRRAAKNLRQDMRTAAAEPVEDTSGEYRRNTDEEIVVLVSAKIVDPDRAIDYRRISSEENKVWRRLNAQPIWDFAHIQYRFSPKRAECWVLKNSQGEIWRRGPFESWTEAQVVIEREPKLNATAVRMIEACT